MTLVEKREFLDFKVEEFNQPEFIETDPVQIPHLFDKKEDIEIAGFLVATIAWGNRKTILKNGRGWWELRGIWLLDFGLIILKKEGAHWVVLGIEPLIERVLNFFPEDFDIIIKTNAD